MISVHKPNEVKQERLGPNTLAQLRKLSPVFKLMEKTTLDRLKERAENRKQFENELNRQVAGLN